MSGHRDVGLLLLRLGVGSAVAAHGAQKLFGSFGGGGIQGTAQFLESQGFTPGKRSALLAGLGEFAGGALLALGLGTGPASAAVTATMIPAASVGAPKFFNTAGGFELPAVYGLAAVSLAITGPGSYSVDAATGNAFTKPWLTGLAYAVGVVSAAYLIWTGPIDSPGAADAESSTPSSS